MKKYIIHELWGSLMGGDYTAEGRNNQEAIKNYLQQKGWEDRKVVYDSIRNHVQGSSHVFSLQEGYVKGDTTYIRGKRYFYKIVN